MIKKRTADKDEVGEKRKSMDSREITTTGKKEVIKFKQRLWEPTGREVM